MRNVCHRIELPPLKRPVKQPPTPGGPVPVIPGPTPALGNGHADLVLPPIVPASPASPGHFAAHTYGDGHTNGNGHAKGNGHPNGKSHSNGNGHPGQAPIGRADGVEGRGHVLDLDGVREKSYLSQIDILERRIKKLATLLEIREDEVRRLLDAPGEEGIASVYESVQGIDEMGPRGKLKRLLMSKIYEANMKLRESVSSSTESAE